jgi:hypothetical protein
MSAAMAQAAEQTRRFRSARSMLGWRGITLTEVRGNDGQLRYLAHRPEVRQELATLDAVEAFVDVVKVGRQW